MRLKKDPNYTITHLYTTALVLSDLIVAEVDCMADLVNHITQQQKPLILCTKVESDMYL